MKDNKKITITYTKKEECEFVCWAPKSKYILIKNIIYTSIILFFCILLNYTMVFLNHINPDKQISMWFVIPLCYCLPVVGIVSTVDEWLHGKNYKEAIKIVQNNTTIEDKKEILEMLENYKENDDIKEKQ